MKRWLSVTLTCLILSVSVSAWSEIPLQLPDNPSQILDFIIPETGPFAGYPLLLCKTNDQSILYWISDPVDPETIGTFANNYSPFDYLDHRLTVDAAGNPIVIEMSWGRCSVIRYDSGIWNPRHAIPISGSEPCIEWASPDELLIDYRMGYDLYRASVNVNSLMTDSSMIDDGYYHSSENPPFWSSTDLLTYYPADVFIYVISKSSYDNMGHMGQWYSETREVSVIPESEYHSTGQSPPAIGRGFLVADWLSGDNWVAMYHFGDNPYRIKSAHSEIIDIGDLIAAEVDATPDGRQYAAWADSTGTMYLMASDADVWLPPEPIFTASPDSLVLAVAEDNKWILFQDDLTWRLIAENPAPATPTPDPDPPPTFTPGPETALLEIHLSRRLFHPYDEFRCALWIQNPSTFNLDGMPVFVLLEVGDTLFFGPGFGTTPDNYLSVIPSIPPDLSMVRLIDSFIWPEGAGTLDGVRMIAAMTDPDVTEIVSNVDIVEFGWRSGD